MRKPFRQTAYRSFISLLPPFILWNDRKCPVPFPHGPGRFPALRAAQGLVKNLSKSVQKRFTLSPALWGILNMSIREAANPFGKQPTDLLFLFYPPFYFVKWQEAPRSVPPRTGAFSCPAGMWGFVKNLSKSVQKWFTLLSVWCGILWLSEGKTPTLPDNSFYTLFSFFHLFFLPSFSFCIGMRPVSLPFGKQGVSHFPASAARCNNSFTAYSKSVHTLSAAGGYTEYVSRGSRKPPAEQPTDLFISLLSPFFKSV